MAKIKTLLFSFILFLILIISSSSHNEIDFDTYFLVSQWDPATCSDNNLSQECSRAPDNKFTIRSLLPTRLSPFQFLGPCTGTPFDLDNIRSMEFSLNQNWPDVISGENEELWADEWENYGTCSEDYLNQLDYFTFALNSFLQQNFLGILANNGITPNSRHYRRDDVLAAINRAIGVRPALRCNVNSISRTEQMHEIGLCFFKETETLRNCPLRASTCTNSFDWFPHIRTLYAYFQLVFQWQPATCYNTRETRSCLQTPELRFSLNGVWPTTRTDVVLGPCNGTDFDINQISSLQNRLDRSWPDLFRRRNNELWSNEWRRHGTCSEDQFSQMQYFNVGLRGIETHDVLGILRRNGITPNGQRYTKQDVENAIIRSIGTRPYLLCNVRRVNGRDQNQFHQMILCYDDNGRQPQNCPTRSSLVPSECPVLFFWFT